MTRIISYFILQTLPIFQIFQGSNGFFSDAVFRLRYSKVAISTTSTSIAAKQRSATRIKTTAFDDHRPRLFILIPAYNEESRIASTLECYQNFLMDPFNDLSSLFQTCKIIIVDDGSTDDTIQVIQNFTTSTSSRIAPAAADDDNNDGTSSALASAISIHIVQMKYNQGKGAALERGFQYLVDNHDTDDYDDTDTSCRHTKGYERSAALILTQDADGSGDLIYLKTMFHKLRDLILISSSSSYDRNNCDSGNNDDDHSAVFSDSNNTVLPDQTIIGDWSSALGMVIGNRNYKAFSRRGITRLGFQMCVRALSMNSLRIADTQCGYKLMTLNTSKQLYNNIHLKGWVRTG